MSCVAESGETSSNFSREFEDYRRVCRDRFQQQSAIPEEGEHLNNGVEDLNEVNTSNLSHTNTTSFSLPVQGGVIFDNNNNGARNSSRLNSSEGIKLNSSVEMIRKSAAGPRRNSLDKVISFFKKSDSPVITREKEKARLEKEKREQDSRMAHLIAELEFSGKSDEEIQMHLFHLREQAQLTPRSNSVGDFFRSMSQAFKDELSVRRSTGTGVENPFRAAPPANYAPDIGYSYEDLLALEPVPRSACSLDHLPVIVFKGEELPTCQTSCAICMTDFDKEEKLRSLECVHYFHMECIDKWLGVGTTCPVCKRDVNGSV